MSDNVKQVAVRSTAGAVAVVSEEKGRRKKPVQKALEEEEFTEVSKIKHTTLLLSTYIPLLYSDSDQNRPS